MILLPFDNHPIRPTSINTEAGPDQNRKFSSFPTLKMNRAAFLIVMMLTSADEWIEFTVADLEAFAEAHGFPWRDASYSQGFAQLLDKTHLDREPFVVEVEGYYRVTHMFVALCFASAPRKEFVRRFEPSPVRS